MRKSKDCGCNVIAQLSALPCKTLASKIPKALFTLYKKGEISPSEAVQIASQLKNNIGQCGGTKREQVLARKRFTTIMGKIKGERL
jgi:hypothetical protein